MKQQIPENISDALEERLVIIEKHCKMGNMCSAGIITDAFYSQLNRYLDERYDLTEIRKKLDALVNKYNINR